MRIAAPATSQPMAARVPGRAVAPGESQRGGGAKGTVTLPVSTVVGQFHLLPQCRNPGVVEPGLAQHFFGVLTQMRGAAPHLRRRGAQLDR